MDEEMVWRITSILYQNRQRMADEQGIVAPILENGFMYEDLPIPLHEAQALLRGGGASGIVRLLSAAPAVGAELAGGDPDGFHQVVQAMELERGEI